MSLQDEMVLTPLTQEGSGVAWGGVQWVAVGSGEALIATSPDGINWTARANWSIWLGGTAVAHNGSMWIAKSPFSGTSNRAVMSIAWNGLRWVAVGFGGVQIATSPDGVNWTRIPEISGFDIGYDVAWNGSYWLAVGRGSRRVARSTDGLNWTASKAAPNSATTFAITWSRPLHTPF